MPAVATGRRPASASRPTASATMAIAKVEPLTTARALRGPFDYRLPERLAGRRGRQRAAGAVRAPAGRSASSSRWPSRASCPRSDWPSRSRRWRPARPPSWCGSASGSRASTARPPPAGCELVLPPGTGPAGRGVRPAARAARRDHRRRARGARATARGSGRASAPFSRRWRPRASRASSRRRAPGCRRRARRAAAARGAWAGRDLRGSSVRRRPRGRRRGRPVAPADAHRRAAAARRRDRRRARRDGEHARAAAPRRHRLGQDRGLPRRRRGGARARPRRDRARSRDRAHAADGRPLRAPGSATASRSFTPGSSAGERRDEWRRLRCGEARVCVGPRSAVFAPVRDLGLIVVDEEHDSSYKQEGDPRYDAREVAGGAPRTAGAVLVCGSATPAAGELGRCPGSSCRERADGVPLPPVEVVDMREAADAHRAASRARPLEALGEVRARRRQGDRDDQPPRVVAAPVSCRSCGRAWGCPDCDVSLVVHQRRRAGFAATTAVTPRRCPASCPDCGSIDARPPRRRDRAGRASWSAERGAAAGVPPRLRQRRAARARTGRILRGSTRADGGVLVGTQMVAQGPRLPRRRPERRPRRRRDPALPGLPRRGADLRARRPARRPQRPRRGAAGG